MGLGESKQKKEVPAQIRAEGTPPVWAESILNRMEMPTNCPADSLPLYGCIKNDEMGRRILLPVPEMRPGLGLGREMKQHPKMEQEGLPMKVDHTPEMPVFGPGMGPGMGPLMSEHEMPPVFGPGMGPLMMEQEGLPIGVEHTSETLPPLILPPVMKEGKDHKVEGFGGPSSGTLLSCSLLIILLTFLLVYMYWEQLLQLEFLKRIQ